MDRTESRKKREPFNQSISQQQLDRHSTEPRATEGVWDSTIPACPNVLSRATARIQSSSAPYL